MKKVFAAILFLCASASAQVVVGNGYVAYVYSAPSGLCGRNAQMEVVVGLGTIYTCQSGTWTQEGGGGTGISNPGTNGIVSCTGTNCSTSSASTALPNGTTATTQPQLDGSGNVATTLYTDTAVSNAVAGVNPAVAVLAASTANLTGTYTQVGGGIGDTFTVTATGPFSLDGIAINTIGQRVLLKNQSTAAQNGIYTATVVGASLVSPVFTRAVDYDTPSDVNNTGAIPVQSGTVNTTTSWLLTSQVTSIGSGGSSLTYTQFSYNPATLVTSITGDGVIFNNSASTGAVPLTQAPIAAGAVLMNNTASSAAPTAVTMGCTSGCAYFVTLENTATPLLAGAVVATANNVYVSRFWNSTQKLLGATGCVQVTTLDSGGTVDVGIYSLSGTTLTRQWHTGPLSTTTATQVCGTSLSTFTMLAGTNYYLAYCASNTTSIISEMYPGGPANASTKMLSGTSAPANTFGINSTDVCSSGALLSTMSSTNITNNSTMHVPMVGIFN